MEYFKMVALRAYSNVAFGNGRLIFNWNGKEIEPSNTHDSNEQSLPIKPNTFRRLLLEHGNSMLVPIACHA